MDKTKIKRLAILEGIELVLLVATLRACLAESGHEVSSWCSGHNANVAETIFIMYSFLFTAVTLVMLKDIPHRGMVKLSTIYAAVTLVIIFFMTFLGAGNTIHYWFLILYAIKVWSLFELFKEISGGSLVQSDQLNQQGQVRGEMELPRA